MKVLFIDEDKASVLPAMDKFTSENLTCDYSGFDDAAAKIEGFQPDIVILDLMNGGATGDPTGSAGKLSYKDIWEHRFCPVIFYSANPDLVDDFDEEKLKHPFVSKVQKGSNSEDRLYEITNSLRVPVLSVIETKKNIDEVIQNALRDLAPLIFSSTDFDGTQNKSLQYLSRRRVAALMDEGIATEQSIPSWGQYIWPPFNNYPKLGDILLKNGEDNTKPESFRLVLTPSCDLVKTSTREPKVDKVLCACCESVSPLLSEIDFSRAKDKKSYISKILTQGYLKEFVPLPCLPGAIPLMIANMKKLELIKYNIIGNESGSDIQYLRIASIDSPFKEQIAQGYINTAGRPGVPVRDIKSWTKQIWGKLNESN